MMPRGPKKGSACKGCGKPLDTRNKLGCCVRCRTDGLRAAAISHGPIREFMKDKVAYYAERAALGLELFDGSPWARLPGAENRLGERQTKFAGTTGTITPTRKIKQASQQYS